MFSVYPPGCATGFAPHTDRNAAGTRGGGPDRRKITAMYYLNPGGHRASPDVFILYYTYMWRPRTRRTGRAD
jgi:hypothetical protein